VSEFSTAGGFEGAKIASHAFSGVFAPQPAAERWAGSRTWSTARNGPEWPAATSAAAHQALLHGHTVRFEKVPDLLEDLAAVADRGGPRRRLTALARPRLLVLDEIGYVRLQGRHADILHAIVPRRYRRRSTMVTTSLGFAQWDRIFQSASGIAGTVDRLMHDATPISIDGDSWRLRRETG